jgi:prepilin-type N-terminal cleavage/methylation domain-containing protein
MRNDSGRDGRRGFTLIELLVVVAIIALLISILLPSLAGARNQAKQALCLSNLKTLGEAMLFYAQANKETIIRAEGNFTHYLTMLLPNLGQDAGLFHPNGRVNYAKLRQAAAETRILQCPNFPEEKQVVDYNVNSFDIPFAALPGDQAGEITGNGPVGSGDDRKDRFTNLGRLKRGQPTEIVLLVEAHARMPLPGDPSWGELTDIFVPEHMALGTFPRVANDPRHPRGTTNTFFDGGARILSLRQLDPGPGNVLADRVRRFTYIE